MTTLAALFILGQALPATSGPALPGTQPLTRTGDLSMEMVAGIDRYLMRALAAAPAARANVQPDRAELRRILGIVEPRLKFDAPTLVATLGGSAVVASTPTFQVTAVRWPVLPGVEGDGLLLAPRTAAKARVVILPDADSTPEQMAGLAPGLPEPSQLARRFAENGLEVLVPVLINRSDTWSGNPAVRMTNQPHREWLHRQLVPVGRHLLGIEVQKVLAAVDWWSGASAKLPIGVAGYGEGALVALMAGALDERISSVLVSGAFAPREEVWRQPIYRPIWGQLKSLGDAEIAGLIAPRTLVVEAAVHPKVDGPPPARTENEMLRRGAAPGLIGTPPLAEVEREFARAKRFFTSGGTLTLKGNGTSEPGSKEALEAFHVGLRLPAAMSAASAAPKDQRTGFDPQLRQKQQVSQLVEYAQRLVRESDSARAAYWKQADMKSVAGLTKAAPFYRQQLWEEVLGKLPPPTLPLVAETRQVYDRPKFKGYEVVIPVWEDVYAYGVLLVPKDLKPGERRPVVVTQHGLNSRPQDTVDGQDAKQFNYYHNYAAALAERGFIVYSPQNPYIGDEQFRVLLRKANPLKLSLFSFIIGQHDRMLDWLSALPFVDPQRIGFYGLSYGGKTAMRVPSLLDRYAAVICSGDFNEWIWKVTSVTAPFSYMFTPEYDMLEWNLGNTFNYAEMSALIAPRPFMVERGHDDGVGIDEWVSYEYAKVRRMYAKLGLPDKTEIEYFNGGHMIHSAGTFDFLHRHLKWPKP
ncbi:MAG: hypothetical protein NTZ56_01620 [Acidobacteria bacterium]|nr:hypothetical protein [Acidobacteriota bacterium]